MANIFAVTNSNGNSQYFINNEKTENEFKTDIQNLTEKFVLCPSEDTYDEYIPSQLNSLGYIMISITGEYFTDARDEHDKEYCEQYGIKDALFEKLLERLNSV
jgi:hypothetical protein